MAKNLMTTARKLQAAINYTTDKNILIDRSQFYSVDQQRTVTVYKVNIAKVIEGTRKSKKELLFETASKLFLTLYLRDYFYTLQGREIPTDVESWESYKRQHNVNYDDNKKINEG